MSDQGAGPRRESGRPSATYVLLKEERLSATTDLRVVIGEDDVLMRAGMTQLLEDAGLDVVAHAGDAPDPLRKVAAHRPDVATCDVQMPPRHHEDGLEAAAEMRRRMPDMGVSVLSTYYELSDALEVIGDRHAGVGYLLKERVDEVSAFVDAIQRVAAGQERSILTSWPGCWGGNATEIRLVASRSVSGRSSHQWLKQGRISGSPLSSVSARQSPEKHVTAIFRKPELGVEGTQHRRVRAVLTYMRGRTSPSPC